jgi:hypothetical protein
MESARQESFAIIYPSNSDKPAIGLGKRPAGRDRDELDILKAVAIR